MVIRQVAVPKVRVEAAVLGKRRRDEAAGGQVHALWTRNSGAVPVGQLVRPARNPKDKSQELTPVGRLPKGRRHKTKREVRAAMAWQPGVVEDKVVDFHVAPLKHPEFTDERMCIAALEAGMADNTHTHCTCDMAQWQALQFEEQFGAQPEHTLCADFYHKPEYVSAPAKALQPDPNKTPGWIAMQARRLKHGDREAILADLRKHTCKQGLCPKTDQDQCTAVAAMRYLTRNGKHMDYQRRLLGEGLRRFRGPRKPRLVTNSTETLELDGLSPTLLCAGMA